MRITWLGHACFLLEEDGYRIVTDPYTGVEGYPPLEAEAHAVYCSHHHFDHDAVDCVRLLPARESPFHVREIQAFHDDQKGALRGPNTIRVFTAGGVSVVHLGDLGHALSAEQLGGHRAGGRACWCRWAVSIRWMPRGPRRPVMPSAPSGSSPCTITMPLRTA